MVLLTVLGAVTIGVLIIAGIIGFLVGTGNAGFFIAPRDFWSKSPADVTGAQMKIGCVVACVFMFLAGWAMYKILLFMR